MPLVHVDAPNPDAAQQGTQLAQTGLHRTSCICHWTLEMACMCSLCGAMHVLARAAYCASCRWLIPTPCMHRCC